MPQTLENITPFGILRATKKPILMLVENHLDPVTIARSIGLKGELTAQQVQGGSVTKVWQIIHQRTRYALRLFDKGQFEQCEYEAKIMEIARDAGLPVPLVYSIATYEDYPILLISWCDGQTLAQALKEQPWKLWPLAKAFGQTQAQIHNVIIPASDTLDTRPWIAWKNQDKKLQKALNGLDLNQRSLIHLDYHFQNVLVVGTKISCVIDWTNARIGDPRADFARTFSILRIEPWDDKPSLVVTLIRWLFERIWRNTYRNTYGKLTDLSYFYVWAGTVMQNDLAYRVEQSSSWFTHSHLDKIKAWTEKQRKKL